MNNNFVDLTPPQSLEAERAVLGSCLMDKEALGTVLEILKPEDFYHPIHRKTLELMIEMSQRDMAVDLLTFFEEMQQRGLASQMGGQPYLASLVGNVPTTANVGYHASIVRDKSIRRQLIDVGTRIVRIGHSAELETSEMLDEAERAIFEISQKKRRSDLRHVGEVLEPTVTKIENAYQKSGSDVSGFASSFPDLDRITAGFQPGSLNIIAARPSMGKTALALNIAQFGGGGSGDAVLIFSLEMSAEQLVQRMLAAQAEVNIQSLNNGTFGNTDWGTLVKAADVLSKRPIYIDDSSMLTTMDFRARCRRFKSWCDQNNLRLGLIIVDYLQLMSFGGRKTDNRQQEVAEISRLLKGVARELSCPVIALSQLSREAERREGKKPQLSDLRDSGAIEQDADTVMLLFREDYYQEEQSDQNSQASLNVAKNRNGPTGIVQLMLHREITRFFSFQGQSAPPGY